MHSNYCVGCGPSVGGVYRSDINWDLCDDCYSDWIENDNDLLIDPLTGDFVPDDYLD